MRICIDPGHGGTDPGAEGFGLLEKNVSLDIAFKLRQFLEQENIEVVMSRDMDQTLQPADRVKLINQLGADYVISIHCNGGPVSAKGVETIYGYGNDDGKRLAENILDQIASLGIERRRAYYKLNAKREDYFYIIREVEPVSIIVETGFITNPSDNHLLSQNSFRKKIANAIATGIYNSIDLKPGAGHWAQQYFERLKQEGLVLDDHVLDSGVTWAEFSAVMARLLDKLV
jgi:N-acetylmuramoyl-L-alanine amidase